MKMFLKFNTIFMTFLLVLIQSERYNTQKKECEFRILEDHLNSLFGYFGYEDNSWPENEKQMTSWCKDVQRDQALAKGFMSTCLKGVARTIPSVMVFTTGKYGKLVCRNKKERASYISKGKCGNAGKKSTTKCWNNVIAIISNGNKLKNEKDKIPHLCCSFYHMKSCTIDSYRKVGSPVCSEANIEHMDQHMDKIVVDAMNIICGDYDDSDKCKKYTDNFDTLTKSNEKWRSPFPPAIAILESIK